MPITTDNNALLDYLHVIVVDTMNEQLRNIPELECTPVIDRLYRDVDTFIYHQSSGFNVAGTCFGVYQFSGHPTEYILNTIRIRCSDIVQHAIRTCERRGLLITTGNNTQAGTTFKDSIKQHYPNLAKAGGN